MDRFMTDPVRVVVEVPPAPAEAFRLFAEHLGAWWPPEYTWSGAVLEAIGIEPRVGGMCWERGPHGFRCDWGRVVAWEPGVRLAFTWQISPARVPEPDPGRASQVSITFTGAGEGTGTTVELVHDGFERHGAGAEGYAEAMGSPQGWPYMLGRYVDAAAARP
jgi:uncharacterized protein YndB with AHSA1/START domain